MPNGGLVTLYIRISGDELLSVTGAASRPTGLLRVLDRMIFTDLFKTFSAILLVLVVVIVSQKFIKVLAQAIEGNIANDTVFMLLGLKTVIVAASFFPAAIFMSVLIVMGRMYQEQEIAAIASAGGGVVLLYRGIFLLIIPLALAEAALSMFAAPWAEQKSQELMYHDKQSADIRGITAGGFSEYSNGELIFYTEKIGNDGTMHHVFVQNLQGDKTGMVNADFGRLKMLPGGLYLVLENGERVLGNAGQKDFVIETFQEYAVLIENKAGVLNLNTQSLPTETLLASPDLRHIAELQSRLNTPVGVLLLAFLAAPLAKISPRGGIYNSLFIAFGIYFVYGNMQRLTYSWVINGNMPVWLGYVWLNGLLFLIGVYSLIRSLGWRWLFQNFREYWLP
ncbi:MAG: LPS export ABC transporter permease LptF [Methylomonas sp.]|jgi:lipopolysaccharide export system permease protein